MLPLPATPPASHSTGAGACAGLGRDPVTQEHVGDEAEAVAWNVPQQHGAGSPVQPRQGPSCPHDGCKAVHRPLVGWLFPKSCHSWASNRGWLQRQSKRWQAAQGRRLAISGTEAAQPSPLSSHSRHQLIFTKPFCLSWQLTWGFWEVPVWFPSCTQPD